MIAKYREQALHCDLPITLDNGIVMMTVVKNSNVMLRNEIIRKNGDLKSVRETIKLWETRLNGAKYFSQ